MYELKYFLAKVKFKLSGNNKEVMSDYFRKAGMSIKGGVQYLLQYYDNGTLPGRHR